MAKLYPPQINGTIPAFYSDVAKGTANIVVPFSMNRAVSIYEINGMELKIKSLNGTLIGVVPSSFIDSVNMEATFNVLSLINKFNIGSYYKVQLAYIAEGTKEIGYYSTVGIIKYTALPLVYIEGLAIGKTNLNKYTYIGVYQQEKDPTEKLYSSRFIIYENNGIFYDSGEKLHNNTEDEYRDTSFETLKVPIELEENKYYTIQFQITTTNGLKIKTNRYRIVQRKSLDAAITAKLIATLNFNNGYILLTLKDEVDKIISGTFVISRCSNVNNWQWETIRDFRLSSTPPVDFKFEDHTIEQGVIYKYSIQQYNNQNGIFSNRIESDEIEADFEDAFLYDGERQLRIRFNPKVSSFKDNIQEAKTDTIGYKYPFFTRNSHIDYKDFPISGLISYWMDENELFIKKNELGIDLITENSEIQNGKYQDWNRNRKDTHYSLTHNLTSRNISAERFFKLNVLKWLNNGKPKSFRSPGEGNYLVRLMNVSLSPNDSLGRMLHTFSCQAYEIADYTLENLNYYNIYDPIETAGTERRWSTINVYEKILGQNYNWNDDINIPEWTVIINNIKMTEIFVEDMMPGSKIRVDGEEITIGTTGSYRAKNEMNPFTSIAVESRSVRDGLITYAYDAETEDSFSANIESFITEDIPCRQFIGDSYINSNPLGNNSINLLDYLRDTKTDILNINMLRVIKRPIIDGFIKLDGQTLEEIRNQLEDYVNNVHFVEDDNFSFTLPTGEIISCKNYFQQYDRPYELPLYQLRVERIDQREQFTEYEVLNLEGDYRYYIYQDLKPYTFEQYYIDKHMDRFCPYTGYYYDPMKNKIIRTADNLFSFYINTETIDVADIETWQVRNLDFIPKTLILNNGVYAEISYVKQNVIYNFENKGSSLADYNVLKQKENYEKNLMLFLLARESAKSYGDITSDLLSFIEDQFDLGKKYLDKNTYSQIFSPFITNVEQEINTEGKGVDYALDNYYNGAHETREGLYELAAEVKDSYSTYIETLDNAIEKYRKEQGAG